MNQTINIFRKDVRHLRLEVLASLAVLGLLVLAEPRAWAEVLAHGFVGTTESMVQFLTIILYLSWAILILRLVHGERLAGLNQFWTTRPYEWPRLLAAKTLFLAVFLYLPLLLAQFCLLRLGGFGIAPVLPALLRDAIFITATMVLPMACIAAVTTSFAQATLSLVGIGMGAAAVSIGFEYLGTVSATLGVSRYPPLFLYSLLTAIGLALLSAVLLLQFGRRATRGSIALMAGALVLVIGVSLTLKGSPAASAGYASVPDPITTVSIDTSGPTTVGLELPKNRRTAVYRIPLSFSNAALVANHVRFDAIRYTLTAADGYRWTSSWIQNRLQVRSGTLICCDAPIDLPWSVHDRFVGGPVAIRIEFLITEMKDTGSYTFPLSTAEQYAPRVGHCRVAAGHIYLDCRYVVRPDDEYFAVSTFRDRGPCPVGSGAGATNIPPENLFRVSGAVGRPVLLREASVSPVSAGPVFLAGPIASGSFDEPSGFLCPGVPVTVTRSQVDRRVRLETQTATIVLKDPA